MSSPIGSTYSSFPNSYTGAPNYAATPATRMNFPNTGTYGASGTYYAPSTSGTAYTPATSPAISTRPATSYAPANANKPALYNIHSGPTAPATVNAPSMYNIGSGSYGAVQQTYPTYNKNVVRMGFVRKVYGILCAQLLLTTAIATPFSFLSIQWIYGHEWILLASVILLVVFICVMACCGQRARNHPENYLFLFVLTVIEAIVIGYISACYTWQSVVLAAGIACLTFLLLTAYAWLTPTDFTGYGPYLFAATCVLLLFGVVLCILSLCGIGWQWLMIVYDCLGVMLFSFYIIFDTQLMLGEYGGHKESFGIDDYAFAALKLYLDIVTLFMYILSLFGKRR